MDHISECADAMGTARDRGTFLAPPFYRDCDRNDPFPRSPTITLLDGAGGLTSGSCSNFYFPSFAWLILTQLRLVHLWCETLSWEKSCLGGP